MRIRETVDVSAPLEEAFRYVGDFSTAADWDPGIVQSRRVNNGPPGVGAVYDVIALFRGKRVPFRYTVTEYDENRRLVLVGEGAKARSTDEITFERTGAGTRIVYKAELELKGLRRLAEPLVEGALRDTGASAIAGLKAALDRPPAA